MSTRSKVNNIVKLRRPRVVVLDIEGTISDISFVSRTLFPFTKNNIKRYFEEMYDTKEAQGVIERLRESKKHFPDFPDIAPASAGRSAVIRTVSEYALAHMIQRSRISEIKQLQILLWVWGYEKGLIKGHVYDEVTTVLHKWKYDYNIKIYLYSSAMVTAQQLLLCFTNHGNCLPLITDCFDSSIGEKTDKNSYLNIAAALDEIPRNILFITDNVKEAQAASTADFQTCIIRRWETATGNSTTSRNLSKVIHDHLNRPIPVISSLEEIKFV